MGQRHRPVSEPLLVILHAVQEDEEVIVLTLVVDLDTIDVSTSHIVCFSYLFRGEGIGWWWRCVQLQVFKFQSLKLLLQTSN